jgi:MOSC domain-containing protein YiiM
MGEVAAIAIAAVRGELPEPVERVSVVAGRGVDGDYHAGVDGNVALTLIASEALDGLHADTGLEISHADTRRNVLTRGVDLNGLVGRRFRVGAVECVGVELCEPCNRLVKLTGERGVLRGLVHRGGLRADVVAGGEIAVGDAVTDAG